MIAGIVDRVLAGVVSRGVLGSFVKTVLKAMLKVLAHSRSPTVSPNSLVRVIARDSIGLMTFQNFLGLSFNNFVKSLLKNLNLAFLTAIR